MSNSLCPRGHAYEGKRCRVCQAIIHQRWVENHPDAVKAARRRHYEKNRERVKEAARDYYRKKKLRVWFGES